MKTYFTINKLVQNYDDETIKNSYIIAIETDEIRKYALYENEKDLYDYVNKYGEKYNITFHEIMVEGRNQKFRFDIDMKIDCDYNHEKEQKFIEMLLEKTKEEFLKVGYNLENKDICLYESHGDTKRSYHIIFKKFSFFDEKDVKKFFDNIYDRMLNTEYCNYMIKYLDLGIYKRNQSLRLFNSKKIGTNRVKKAVQSFKLGKEIIKCDNDDFVNFLNSLVTNTHECFLVSMPIFISKCTSMVEHVYDDIIKLFKEKKDFKCFTIRDVTKYQILLSRLESSYCNICRRPHEFENPYIYYVRNNVYFNCRRSTESYLLGNIGKAPFKEVKRTLTKKKEVDLPQFFMGKLGIKTGNNSVGYSITKPLTEHFKKR